MTSSLVRSGFVRGSMTQGNGCYLHRCANDVLEVAVDGVWKTCPREGGRLKFPGFNGMHLYYTPPLRFIQIEIFSTFSLDGKILISDSLTTDFDMSTCTCAGHLECPMYHELCDDSPLSISGQCNQNCHGNGECIEGKCHCFFGFGGDDCRERT